jgi:hypothetical protein
MLKGAYVDVVDFAKASASFERHLKSPEVSVVDHYWLLREQVAETVRGRRRLYLDTRYWVFIRDAALGRAKKPEHEAILKELQERVTSGIAICPVSDVAVMEMTAQTDEVTRAATAKLWDELSLGVALQTEPERVRTEFEQFFRYPRVEDVPRPLSDLVWTRPCFVFGETFPSLDGLPQEAQVAFQKAALDGMWATSFSEMGKESAAELAMSDKFQRTAEGINGKMRQFQHEIPTFDKAFLSEISGALDGAREMLAEAVLRQFVQQGNSPDDVTKEQVQRMLGTMRTALTNAFRLRRKLMAKRLPTVYLHALSHAAIRSDVKRKFNGNFLRDIHHGNAGVGYYDAVFTERPLMVLLTAGNVAADRTFACKVMSDEREVLSYLKGTSAQRSAQCFLK